MGTRSVLAVKDEDGKPYVKIYRQMDGYPTGRGQAIKDAFGKARFCNGISIGKDDDATNLHNGMGCFAATVVKTEKEGIGSIYLYNGPVTGEEWGYVLKPTGIAESQEVTGLSLEVYHGRKKVYDGPLVDADMKAIEAGN